MPLICERCGQEIRPGSMVEFIGEDIEEQRIVVADEALVVHATCPSEGGEAAQTDA